MLQFNKHIQKSTNKRSRIKNLLKILLMVSEQELHTHTSVLILKHFRLSRVNESANLRCCFFKVLNYYIFFFSLQMF